MALAADVPDAGVWSHRRTDRRLDVELEPFQAVAHAELVLKQH